MYQAPSRIKIENDYLKLIPMSIKDSKSLFEAAKNSSKDIFYHMFFGPFDSIKEIEDYIKSEISNENKFIFTVYSKRMKKIVGTCSIIDVNTTSGNAEIGSIWYSSEAQNTEVNTIAAYLLLVYLFDTLHYRRVVWKCDDTNILSKNAALALGFEYEGLFRKHLIIKGRNRDTAWFSIIEDNWPRKKIGLENRIQKKLRYRTM